MNKDGEMITQEEMHEYGYLWDEMIPLTKAQALKEFLDGNIVYRLYQDDAEGMIDTLEEIYDWNGMFGTEKYGN